MITFWYNSNVMIFRELWVDTQIYTEYTRGNVDSKLFDNMHPMKSTKYNTF
jgi:hypothetical protein